MNEAIQIYENTLDERLNEKHWYLVLTTYVPSSEDIDEETSSGWNSYYCTLQNMYDMFKLYIKSGWLYPDKSFILEENQRAKDAKTVYSFMRSNLDNHLVIDNDLGFSLDDYLFDEEYSDDKIFDKTLEEEN